MGLISRSIRFVQALCRAAAAQQESADDDRDNHRYRQDWYANFAGQRATAVET